MDYNIIIKYTNYLKKEFLEFFRIIFENNYVKKTFAIFVDRYINVRYFDETDYSETKDFVTRINKELISIYDALKNEENEELLKNVVALFGYLIYFDDIGDFTEEAELINSLISDENITIKIKANTKSSLLKWYVNLKKNKELFENTISSREFNISEKRIARNTYQVQLEHSVKISNLYSEYAIDKAYNMDTIVEQRLFITYIMTSFVVLQNAKYLDFSKSYVVPFSSSLFNKEKKIKRLLNTLDNPLAKKRISILINYSDYAKHKDFINSYITEGYSFAILLDTKFTEDISKLILFSYVFMSEDYELYDIIIKDKDKIKSKFIIL